MAAIATVMGILSSDAAASEGWVSGAGFRSRPTERIAVSLQPGFIEMPATTTGVLFTNTLADESIAKNFNLMLGSGVAAGDFDGDGWCDLYFCAIEGRNALFRNLGGWRFKDVTALAGVALEARTNTGAAFADINGDGRPDLLVSSLGRGVSLLLNQGNGTFRDATRESGFEASTGSLTLALGDVDGDGDLDLYVCNYGAQALSRGRGEFFVKTVDGKTLIRGAGSERMRVVAGKVIELGEPDTLFLNKGGGKFEAVAWGSSSFLDEEGRPLAEPWDFGLSAQFRDVNGDGAPDLYVCNDFDTPDRFWINDGRGQFRLIPRLAQRSQSYASMGVDFADLDRDGHLDFLVVEMLSPDHVTRLRQRTPALPTAAQPGVFENRPEIARNTLFRGRGDGTFAEVANFAGLAASDWSWQGAFLDVDLDGLDDVMVVNGHQYDTQDMDAAAGTSAKVSALVELRSMPHLFTPNRSWRNLGGLRFEESSRAWGFAHTNVSHGLAFADLDNDGDLDAVVNCLNAPPLLLRNNATAPRVAVRLRGSAPNTCGIGAKITVRAAAMPVQTHEMVSGGKYLSCDDSIRTFATGSVTNELTIEVVWRSGKSSLVKGAKVNRIYEIDEAFAGPKSRPVVPHTQPLFADAGELLRHSHHESLCDDFQLQPLLTRKLSQRGPGACVTDLDGDGHEDLLFGSGRGGQLSLHRGDGRGRFVFAAGSQPVEDDVLALVEWAPTSGVRSVLAAMADHETVSTKPPLRLITVAGGEIRLDPVPAPEFTDTPSVGYCLATADYDFDGHLDVFVGAHAIPGRYPQSAKSRLFRNERGTLRLDRENTDVLLGAGLVNSAVWTDLDGDGRPDLALACEWGPVRVFRNESGKLREATTALGLASHTGWWTGLAAADFDGDGRLDLLAGNWGLNGPERASPAEPLRLFHGDFMRRGIVDLLETEYDSSRGAEPLPSRQLNDVAQALPVIRERYPDNRRWAAATAREVLAPFTGVAESSATTLATTIFLNRGDRFEARPLPDEAQWAPVNGVIARDFDGDGHADAFLSQNFFALRPDQARLDSGRGLLLRGDGRGGLRPMRSQESGIAVYGEQRAAVSGDFDADGRLDLVVTQNGTASRYFRNSGGQSGLRVKLDGSSNNPRAIGAMLRVEQDGRLGSAMEIHGGSGWLAHESPVALLGRSTGSTRACRLHIRWPDGRRTVTEVPAGTRELTVRPPDRAATN